MDSPAEQISPPSPPAPLTPEEIRVLGCLVEKSYTTPDVYPMTVNGLVSACNQRSSRFPVVQYDEDTVRRALDTLRDKGWSTLVHTAGARVQKYRHEVRHEFNFADKDVAVICVLMLRGPQTFGELRGRTERIAKFEHAAAVEATLRELMSDYPRPLVAELSRGPGQKDSRFMHLFGEERPEDIEVAAPTPSRSPAPPRRPDAVDELTTRVEHLESTVADLQSQLDAFRKQFE